ncbi:hypothetical protein FACS1894187_15140 [Synergistales bacterium]|nr:hypothetical protein FACS1894187_15140 [Synergistales bacterium]
MEEKKFAVIMEMLVPQIIATITEHKKNMSDQEAIALLYGSTLYEGLEAEETKLWHLSAETLYTLLDEEITTGKITYPEEA